MLFEVFKMLIDPFLDVRVVLDKVGRQRHQKNPNLTTVLIRILIRVFNQEGSKLIEVKK